MSTENRYPGAEKKTRMWGILPERFRIVRRSKSIRPISLFFASLAMLATVLGVIGLVMPVGSVQATPASGVTPQILGQATLDPFHIQTPDFKVHSKKVTDLIVQQVTFDEGGHTGWHSHPGMPVLLVKEGHIALTLADGCTTQVYGPGEGFVEHPGEVMIARNAGGPGEKAVTIVSFLANPAGVPARTDEADPGCD
jgi:quercetin dioxygenase-like cupin family protein